MAKGQIPIGIRTGDDVVRSQVEKRQLEAQGFLPMPLVVQV
jgi:hypothetical protein